MTEVEYQTLYLAAHTDSSKLLNVVAKEGWRVICSYGERTIILCREIKVPVKAIPLDMLPSDAGGLAQKTQKGDCKT